MTTAIRIKKRSNAQKFTNWSEADIRKLFKNATPNAVNASTIDIMKTAFFSLVAYMPARRIKRKRTSRVRKREADLGIRG
jgi:hypothetical protein